MRQRPVEAAGQTLAELLAELNPALKRFLNTPHPALQIILDNDRPALRPAKGRPGRYALGRTGLVADVRLEYFPDLGVARQCVELTNESAAASPGINEINAFFLPLKVRLKDAPQARWLGGGLTDGFYPPRAWRLHSAAFGKARTWDVKTGGDGWWTGKRWCSIGSNPGGRSSNPDFPLMIFGWEARRGGAGLWAAMEWSGRWEMAAGTQALVHWEVKDGVGGWARHKGIGKDWDFVFRGGPRGIRGMVLQPGETLRLPPVNVGVWSGRDTSCDDAFNSVRRFVARALSPDVEGRRPAPVIGYSHWFGLHSRISDALLRPQVDRAAELGAEYFEVDAGWYGGSTENFANGVGNWERVDGKKFPDGLDGFVSYVHSRGLRFGLWFEPERGRLGSDWVTQHPDWYWKADNPVNFHLDLTQRKVQDGLIEMLSRWITRLDIRWLRWDCNQEHGPFWDKVDPTGKVQFAYIEGLYRVQDALLERHPNLMIDACAGGGTRTDFGTLRRAGTTVISDHAEDPHVCRIMQTGGARLLPGYVMNSSIGVSPDSGDKAIGPLELMSRMCGALTLNGAIASWSPRHARFVRRYLDGYRTFRHLLTADFHPLTPYPRDAGDWDIVEFVDGETREAVVLCYRMRGHESVRTVYPKHLAPGRKYEIVDPFSAKRSPRRSGRELMDVGLRITLKPESAAVRHLKPVG